MKNDYFKMTSGLDQKIIEMRAKIADMDSQIDKMCSVAEKAVGADKKRLINQLGMMGDQRAAMAVKLSELRDMKNQARKACIEDDSVEIDTYSMAI